MIIDPSVIRQVSREKDIDPEKMFAALDFIVVDELHAFLRGPRGIQLASLFRRS